MCAAGQAAQDVCRIGGVERFADDFALELQRRVRRQDRLCQQPAPADAAPAVLGLGACNALYVGERIFIFQRRFIGFLVGTRSVAEDQRIEGDTDLRQQLAPARGASWLTTILPGDTDGF